MLEAHHSNRYPEIWSYDSSMDENEQAELLHLVTLTKRIFHLDHCLTSNELIFSHWKWFLCNQEVHVA